MTDLQNLLDLVTLLKTTTSSNKKKEYIASVKSDIGVGRLLVYTHSPYIHFGVSSRNVIKNESINNPIGECIDIYTLLDNLSNRVWTGHTAIGMINGFVTKYPQFKEIVFAIIDKDLKTRAGTRIINNVIPGLIPTFSVALAEKLRKMPDFVNEQWIGSRKLDGVRCIIRKEGTNIDVLSRQGKQFTTLNNIAEEVSAIPHDFVLDGEVCIMDENGNEDFQGIMKEIRKKDHTIKQPMFHVFDLLTLTEFDNQTSERIFSDRIQHAKTTLSKTTRKHIHMLDQDVIVDETQLDNMTAEAENNGFEGLMIRKDVAYDGKRSKDILKVKKFSDAEYVVERIVSKSMRYIDNGEEYEAEMLSNIIILHKGNEVGVGSGWSMAERKYYFANPDELIGKTVTVTYFEESQNQNGNWSLRFPTLKIVHGDERMC